MTLTLRSIAALAALAALASPSRADDLQAKILGRHVAAEDFCAWPNITRLPNDSLAAVVFNKPSHGRMEGEVECWTSRDGQTWRHAGNPAPHAPGTNRMNVGCGLNGQGNLVVLCSGWQLKLPTQPGGTIELDKVLPAWSSISANGGSTWTINKTAFPPAEPNHTEYVPFGDVVIAADGSLRVTAYSRNTATTIHSVWMFRSADDGASWERFALIAEKHNETTLHRVGGTQWLAAARRHPEGQPLDLLRSDDDGRSWTLQEQITQKAQHPADLLKLADGRLLLTYGNRTPGEFGVAARFSADDGATWGPQIKLVSDCVNGDCGYPASNQRTDGAIVTGFYTSGTADRGGYHFATVIWEAPR